MHAYVVIASKSGGQIDPMLLRRVAKTDLPDLAFEPDESVHWTNANQSVHFCGWQAFTEFHEIGSHWHIDESGLTAFSGYCWPREIGWDWGRAPWATQLAHFFTTHDPRSSNEDLFGIYSAVAIPTDGVGYIVTDLVSSGVVYVAEAGDALILSSRSALCATAITTGDMFPERDVIGAGWTSFNAYPESNVTGFAGVKTIPFGSHVRLDPMHGAQIDKPAKHYWESAELAALPTTFEALGARLERELRETIRAIAAFPASIRQMRLSGGRDSRLVAALIMLEGVHDRFEFMTFGLPHTPDVIVAGTVADTLGLSWTFQDRGSLDEWDIPHLLRTHVFQVSGAQSGWDHKGQVQVSPDVKLAGLYSEFFRIGAFDVSTLTSGSLDQARAALLAAINFDEHRLLRPEARQHYLARFSDWLESTAQEGVDLQRLGSMTLPHFHTRRLHGAGTEIDACPWLFPLYTPAAIRVIQYLPPDHSQTERFHFDIIRKCSEQLAKLPFVTKPWSQATYAHLPNAGDYEHIGFVTHQGPDSTHWRLAHFDQHRPLFRDILLNPSNPVYEVLNFARVKRMLDAERIDAGQLRHLYGCLSAAIWLGGHELPARMNRSGELNTALRTNGIAGPIVVTGSATRTITQRGDTHPPSSAQPRSEPGPLPVDPEAGTAQSVMMVVPAFPVASESFVADQFLHLLVRGWDVHVVATRSSRQEWEAFPEIASQPTLTSRIHARPDLADVLDSQRPRIAHFQSGDLAREHLDLCQGIGAAGIVSLGDDICFHGLHDPRYYDAIWRQASAIHTMTGDIWKRAQERGCPSDAWHRTIHGSVDSEFFDPGDRVHTSEAGAIPRPLRVLSVGSLEWKHGIEFSLRAVRELIDLEVHAELTIVGEGSHREALLFESRDLGLDDRIHFVGTLDREGLRRLMLDSDVFVDSSLSDSFGFAIAQAQSMGLPVICTPTEIVLGQVTGFVVPHRDPSEVAAKLRRLAADPDLRTRLGSAGRVRMLEHFRIDQEIDAIERLYREVLDRPARARQRYNHLRQDGSPRQEADLFAYLRLEKEFNERLHAVNG